MDKATHIINAICTKAGNVFFALNADVDVTVSPFCSEMCIRTVENGKVRITQEHTVKIRELYPELSMLFVSINFLKINFKKHIMLTLY